MDARTLVVKFLVPGMVQQQMTAFTKFISAGSPSWRRGGNWSLMSRHDAWSRGARVFASCSWTLGGEWSRSWSMSRQRIF